ncbi:MAG: TonB-dependent receptor [Bacteroidota bacterium]
MRVLTCCLLLISCCTITAFAQNEHRPVQGVVLDTTKAPLPGATVVLVNASDSVMHSFTISDVKGNFSFKKVPIGQYLLQISYLGYRNLSQNVEIEPGNEVQDLGSIILDEDSQLLDGVDITADRIPIVIKEDTIEYNAAAFKTQNNAVVEDLLKKLPGVEVEADGTVKAQGEEVQKVLVDGKEFFGNDATIATKNLPANAVDKVQVFDKMSEMSEFTGIDDGNSDKTINLTLKEDKKNGIFGNISGGYGSEERYATKANINRFSKTTQFSVLGSSNNINEQNFSINDYINFMGGFQNFASGGGGLSLSLGGQDGALLGLGGNNGIRTTTSTGINLNHDFSKRTELSGNYFYNRLSNELDRNILRQNFLEGQNFSSEENSDRLDRNDNHRLNLRLKHEINKMQDLSFRTTLRFNDGFRETLDNNQTFNTEGVLENESQTDNTSIGQGFSTNNQLLYRRKFNKKGRSFVADFTLNYNEDDRTFGLFSENVFNPLDPNTSFSEIIRQNQIQQNDGVDYGINLSYTEPLGKRRYLEFSYSRQNYANDFLKNFFDINNEEEQTLNETLSSFYKRDYTYDRGGLKLRMNSQKSNLTLGVSAQQSELTGDIISEDIDIQRDFFNILPSARFKHDFTSSKNISINYSTQVREPSLQQLQPVLDNSNPLNAYVGNPELKAEYRHNLRFNFVSFSQFNFTSFFSNATITYTRNRITNARTIDELFRQTTQPVNVDFDMAVRSYSSFSAPLKFIGAKTSLTYNTQFNRSILFINEVENNTNRWTNSIDVRLENRKKNAIDVMAGMRLTLNQTRYSVNTELDQNFVSRLYYFDFTATFLKTWNFNTAFDFTVYEGQAFGNNQEVPIWRASISKSFLKQDRGELKLSVFDLLNRNLGIDRSSQFNFIQDERFNTLSRYAMLTFSYALSKFGNNRGGITIKESRR